MSYWSLPLVTYKSYFMPVTDRIMAEWDGTIGLENVPDRLDWMRIVKPLPCGDNYIRPTYDYNGASSGPLQFVPIFGFPKWRHPIATARHDFLCDLTERLRVKGIISLKEARRLRRIADELFKKDISIGQESAVRSWWEQTKGYVGVRIGAFYSYQIKRRFFP